MVFEYMNIVKFHFYLFLLPTTTNKQTKKKKRDTMHLNKATMTIKKK